MKPLKGIKLKENRILIKKFDKEVKTKAGIIMPDDQQIAPEGGVIVAVGPTADKTLAKVGDKVRYMLHGQEQLVNGDTYYLLRDGDVWGEIE